MDTVSRHLLVEYHGCNGALLDDQASIEALMNEAARAAEVTVVASVFHAFAPQGVSGVVVIEESHLSIHTWPEHGYAAVDFYTCGEGAPDDAVRVLRDGLEAERVEVMVVDRGLYPPKPSARVRSHYAEGELAEATELPSRRAESA